jgi:thiamine kinase-like enzyme
VPDVLDATIERITAWAGRPITHTPIKGGLSHYVARVEADGGGPWLLRVLDPRISEAGLGIPLEQEITNTIRAAEAGVGPQVLLQLPGALLLEYLDGVTMDIPAVRDPANRDAIADACRRLHAGPRFVNDFSIFRKLDELLALCRANRLSTPDGYEDWLPVVGEIEQALAVRPLPAVPCHNDLLAENLIACGDEVRIVDYQLSGNNDPAFELGDIAAESDYDPDMVAALTRAYFGDEELVARVRLYLTMSNFTWTLWFTIHRGLLSAQAGAGSGAGSGGSAGALGPAAGPGFGAATFDYDAEAADKFAQAVRDLRDPGLGRLIDAVQGRRPSGG